MKPDKPAPSLRTSRFAPQTTIDQVMVEERAGSFAKRSIKTSAKLAGLKMAISMMDLTTLEGKRHSWQGCVSLPQGAPARRPEVRRAAVRRSLRLSEHGEIRAEISWRPFARESGICRHRISQRTISVAHQTRRSPPRRA